MVSVLEATDHEHARGGGDTLSIRAARVIAVDGTQASGKTTFKYRLASELRMRGINIAVLDEPARASPLIDDVVLYGDGEFDIFLELDLFAAHLMTCARAARQHQLILADKTPTNVLAYSQFYVAPNADSWALEVLGAMAQLGEAWGQVYDAIYYLSDTFEEDAKSDRYRSKVVGAQDDIDALLRQMYTATNLELSHVPLGRDLDHKVAWTIEDLERKAII